MSETAHLIPCAYSGCVLDSHLRANRRAGTWTCVECGRTETYQSLALLHYHTEHHLAA